MRKVFVLCGILAAATLGYSPCFANGGPIDVSAFDKTGDIVPVQKTSLQIEEETLLLVIKGDYVEVAVNYEIYNASNKDEEITFSFPLEVMLFRDVGDIDDEKEVQQQKNVIKAYAVLMNGKNIPVVVKEDAAPIKKMDIEIKSVFWHTSVLAFKKKARSNLVVSYIIRSRYQDSLYSKSPLPEFSERSFKYSFNAAAGFGNGKANKMSVIIDASDLVKRNGKINSISFAHDTLQKQVSEKKSLLTFRAESFDFSKSKILEITYDCSNEKRFSYVMSGKPSLQKIVSIKASSTLPGPYDPKNIFDGDFLTAWCEGAKGDGEGEWIEFSVKDFVLEAVFLVNGYTKNYMSLENNSRASLVHVTKLGKNPAYEETRVQESQKEMSLLGYEDFYPLDPLSFSDWVLNTFDYASESTVRITIKKTRPGKKFNDTCISEIYLLGYPVVDQNKK